MLRNDIRRWLVAGNDRSNAAAKRLGEIATVGLNLGNGRTPRTEEEGELPRRAKKVTTKRCETQVERKRKVHGPSEDHFTPTGIASGGRWDHVSAVSRTGWPNKRRDGVRHNQRTHARTHRGPILSERVVSQRTEVSCRPQVHSDSMAGVRSGLRADAHTHVWLSHSREPVRS